MTIYLRSNALSLTSPGRLRGELQLVDTKGVNCLHYSMLSGTTARVIQGHRGRTQAWALRERCLAWTQPLAATAANCTSAIRLK